MKRIEILDWIIEIDYEKTKEYYQRLGEEEHTECCLYCKNFDVAIRKVNHKLLKLLEELGISPEEPVEKYELHRMDSGNHQYGIIYLLVGRIIKEPDGLKKVNEKGHLEYRGTDITEDAYFIFGEEICVPGGVMLPPQPVLQLDVFCELPWELEEKPNTEY